MQVTAVSPQTDKAAGQSSRLHYLDWLRVLAILMVFLFHAVHPFDVADWHIKNAEQSVALTVVLALFSLWGLPFIFLIAGAGNWFALQRRTASQYATERFKRLLTPFIAGAVLFMPIMLYFEWMHKTATNVLQVSWLDFVLNRQVGFSPRWFGVLGYHLWFLGFLFSFAMAALPLLLWLKGESGKAVVSRMAQWCERPGGILLFILPLLLVQLSLRPLFPNEHDWADFFFQMTFFVLGYILFSDERFAQAIRRDWILILTAAISATAFLVATIAFGDPYAWSNTPGIPEFYFVWSLITVSAWCWSLSVLCLSMRLLNISNAWLRYGQEAVLPFFVAHQPLIIVIAFYVVQWNVGIPIKMLAVVLSSFVVFVGLYELIIRRINSLRALFGMTSKRIEKAQSRTVCSSEAEKWPA